MNRLGYKVVRPSRLGGFTLVEILIVVIILGILAAVVIPKFSTASVQTRENILRENLRMFRTQIGCYKITHNDIAPGYPGGNTALAPTEQAFIDQMTMSTDENCATAAAGTPGFPFGPYLRTIPANSVNRSMSVQIVANGAPMPAVADDDDGWVYKPEDIAIRADAAGNDQNNQPYYGY